jgi:thiol-disulfide isomerase/thioredoxin
MRSHNVRTLGLILLVLGLLTGCEEGKEDKDDATQPDTEPVCTTGKAGAVVKQQPTGTTAKQPKRIWAQSYLYCDAPKLEVSEWLTKKPELKDKFVLIEFWRTWCGACKRAVPKLNSFHEKYGKELVVIAVTGQPKETVEAYDGPEMKYFRAIDAPGTLTEEEDAVKDQGATEEKYRVWGWPHVVLLEPEHQCVIWEGYPDLKGYELTAEKIEKALAIGRQRMKDKK